METIDISIISEDTSEVFFKMKKNTPLHKAFNAYKERQAIAECVFFYINNVRINATDTPKMLNLKSGDKIYSKIIKTNYHVNQDDDDDTEEYDGGDIDDDDIPEDILNKYKIDNEISILIMNGDDIFQCTVRETTLLVSYLTSYTGSSSAMLFFYNGDELGISDTPNTLGMVDGAMVQIFTSG
jgi:small ubiquitin-related modifier